MPFIIAIGVGAGVASALMTLSVAGGGVLALALVYLAVLPLLLAGLGYGHYVAALGLCAGAILLANVHSPHLAVLFAITTGLPAWIFSFVAERSARAGRHMPTDLLMAAAVLAPAIAIAMVLYIGGLDHDAYQDAIRKALAEATGDRRNMSASTLFVPGADVVNVLAAMLAYMLAISIVLQCVANLYLAGRILRASGRLPFAWPNLSDTRLPKSFGFAMALAALVSFVAPGFAGHAASLVLTGGLIALALAGLAALHAMTRKAAMRPLILFGVYMLTLMFGLPILILALLGLADSQYDLRNRIDLSNL